MYDIGYDEDDYLDEMLEGEYLVEGDFPVEIGLPRSRLRKRRRANRRAGRRMARRGQTFNRAMAARQAMTGTVVRSEPPTQSRELVLGFDSGAAGVAALATANITANPQKVFRPERIAVNSAIAASFTLNILLIGTNNQLIGAGAVSCDTFSTLAVATRMKMDTAQINSTITMNVTNLTGGALRFLASLIGTTVS